MAEENSLSSWVNDEQITAIILQRTHTLSRVYEAFKKAAEEPSPFDSILGYLTLLIFWVLAMQPVLLKYVLIWNSVGNYFRMLIGNGLYEVSI